VWNAVRDAVSPRPVLVLARPYPPTYAWSERPVLPSMWDGACGVSRRGPPRSCAAA